jgi:glyoxylase-like metal-dependent hydrolase (beta-lactamase superfamily II)
MVLVDGIQVGVLATNCYVVRSENSTRCVVIDPGGQPQLIFDFLDQHGLRPDRIISTHAHADHTGAVAPLLAKYADCEFAMGATDVKEAARQLDWLKNMLGDFEEPPEPSRHLDGGDTLPCDGFEITVLATPGHTSGSISLHIDGYVFTGDTLFRETIGRFDLTDGDQAREIESIRTVLFALDDSTAVMPGHGPTSTIGHERTENPYV